MSEAESRWPIIDHVVDELSAEVVRLRRTVADEPVRLDLERIKALTEAEFYARRVARDFANFTADEYAIGARDAALDIALHLRSLREKST